MATTSVSSLINRARAARNHQNAINDQAADYEFGTSAQTEEDYQAYDAYLSKRQSETTDAGKQLTIASRRNSAFSNFTNNEIQRQTMAVETGEQSNVQKYNAMLALYEKAKATGNANQVQNLASKLISLDKTIQKEAEVAGEKASAAGQKAFKKGVSNALSIANQSLNILKSAYNSNDVLRDEADKPILGRLETDPKTGALSIVLDEKNGQPIKLTARQMAQAKAYNMLQRAQILQDAVDSGMDEEGKYQYDLDALKATPEFQKSTAKGLLERLNRTDGGENPFTNKVDPVTGVMSSELRNVADFVDGANIYKNGFLANVDSENGVDISYNRKNGTSPGDIKDNYTVQSYQMKNPDGTANEFNRKLKDPVTGKTLYAGTSNDGILNPGIPGTIPQAKEDLQAGKAVNYLDPSNFVNPLEYYKPENMGTVTQDFATAADALAKYGTPNGLINTGMESVRNVLGLGVQQRKAAAVAQAKAAAESLARAKSMADASAARVPVMKQQIQSAPKTAWTPPQQQQQLKQTMQNVQKDPIALAVAQSQVAKEKNVNLNPAPQNKKVWWNPTTWFK